jgi:ribosomal peptide maturation radical SAM protein 1
MAVGASLDILLVVMPFGPVFQPSLGASIIRQSLDTAGLHSRIEYFSIEFLEVLGLEAYEKISEYYPDTRRLLGEWLFSHTLYPAPLTPQTAADYVQLGKYHSGPDFDSIAKLCQRIGSSEAALHAFVDEAAERVLAASPKIVGFTTMFQQHVASLAVSKKIKRASPETFIVFGGANVEGPMGVETLRSFPWIDAVVSGRGEIVLPLIVRDIVEGRRPPLLPGVMYQNARADDGKIRNAPEASLDDTPPTDFNDFFEAFSTSKLLSQSGIAPSVLIETSRGCWWGQKHHCTFCGLNGAEMTFRMKSSERALSDLRQLAGKYPTSRIVVTDNIMPQSYYRELIPRLDRSEFPSGLFFEVKANATEQQVASLAAGGVDIVQVGIENFSANVLQHMRKGVSCITNIAFLKYCASHGVLPSWILLTGFTCETEWDYHQNIDVVRMIRHFRPPQVCSEIRIDRFSPNHTNPRQFGFSSISPIEAYSEIYRDPSIRLEELAYFFEGHSESRNSLQNLRTILNEEVTEWQRRQAEFEFWVIEAGDEDLLLDSRNGTEAFDVLCLDKCSSSLLRSCEQKTSVDALCRSFRGEKPEKRLEALEKRGIVFSERGAVISLPLRLGHAKRGPSRAMVEALTSCGLAAEEEQGYRSLRLSFGIEAELGMRSLTGGFSENRRNAGCAQPGGQ